MRRDLKRSVGLKTLEFVEINPTVWTSILGRHASLIASLDPVHPNPRASIAIPLVYVLNLRSMESVLTEMNAVTGILSNFPDSLF